MEINSCKYCGSNNLKRITGDDEHTIHYGRLVCAECNGFLDWIKDPSNEINLSERNEAIAQMLKNPELLSNWDSRFLHSIRKQSWLSDRQKEQLNRLSDRILGQAIC